MTTAREDILRILCNAAGKNCGCANKLGACTQMADGLLADESVRMELARQLLPDMKSYAQFKTEARALKDEVISRSQHEALMAGAMALEILCNKGGTASLDDWTEAEAALAALRASGIDTEEKR